MATIREVLGEAVARLEEVLGRYAPASDRASAKADLDAVLDREHQPEGAAAEAAESDETPAKHKGKK